jgi:uncharacterized protein YegL
LVGLVALALALISLLSVPSVAAQADPPPPACAPNCFLVGDRVWNDANRNGVQDEGEQGVPGITVTAYESDAAGNVGSVTLWTTVTNQSGVYQLELAAQQWYTLRFDLAATTTFTFTIHNAGTDDTDDSDVFEAPNPRAGFSDPLFLSGNTDESERWDAGIFDRTDCRFIGDTIWRDKNDNETFEPSVDEVMPGVKVSLLRKEFIPVWPWDAFRFTGDYDFTDANGIYKFLCLEDDDYSVMVPDLGVYRVNPDNDPNVNNLQDDDNNLLKDPELIISPPLPEPSGGATKAIHLEGAHPNPDYTIDGSFICNDQRLDVLFVLDISGSMKRHNKYDDAKAAALSFIAQMDFESGYQKAGLVLFGHKLLGADATLVQPLTGNRNQIDTAVSSSSAKNQGTNIGAGIEVATEEFLGGNRTPGSQAVMIVLTDGRRTKGPNELDAARDAKNDIEGLTLVTIGLGNDAHHGRLRKMASNPGDYYYAPSSADLIDIFNDIIVDICGRTTGDLESLCDSQGGRKVVISLDTGSFKRGDEDGKWRVSSWYGVGPHPVINARIVGNPHPLWERNKLPGASVWIAHRRDAKSRDGTDDPGQKDCLEARNDLYVFQRSFDLEGSPAQVELDITAISDDNIEQVVVNGTPLDRALGGPFSGDAVHVFTNDAGLFVPGANTIGVPSAPNDPGSEVWPPNPDECARNTWTAHGPTPEERVNPNNPDEKAYCMRVWTACCQYGVFDLAPASCSGDPVYSGTYDEDDTCNQCGYPDLYRFPNKDRPETEPKIRLSFENLAAAVGRSETPWPLAEKDNHPAQGRFRILEDADGEGEVVLANADKGTANIRSARTIERYTDPCWERPGGRLGVEEDVGCTVEERFQWVIWEPVSPPPTCDK